MDEFTAWICIGACFDNKDAAYKLIAAFYDFLEENVPDSNLKIQDIKLGYNAPVLDKWSSK